MSKQLTELRYHEVEKWPWMVVGTLGLLYGIEHGGWPFETIFATSLAIAGGGAMVGLFLASIIDFILQKKYRDLYKFRFDERESICPVVEVTTNE